VSTAAAARLRWLDRGDALLAVFAMAMLLLRYGFPALALPPGLVLAWSALLPIGLFTLSLLRLLLVREPLRYLRRHPLRHAVLLMILLELSGVAGWSAGGTLGPGSASMIAGEAYLAIVLLAFAGSWAKGLVVANRWLANRHLPVLALAPLGFALAIGAGTLLLALPGLQRQPVPWIDSLFTATSAVCVTGLTVYDVGSALSPVGLIALALLIQLGGLGIITLLGMLALWRGGPLSPGERVAFGTLLGGFQLAAARRFMRTLANVVLGIELVGAVLLWLLWRGDQPQAMLMAGFHAISAFCNAGFSPFADSLARFAGDPATLAVFMALIVAGGIGAPVIADLAGWTGSRLLPWAPERSLRRGSRLALGLSAALILAGGLILWLDARATGRSASLLALLFQSVTTRTAGFQVESQLHFGALGLWATLVLMIIGASPQSTGGGLKTSVLARLFAQVDGEAAAGRRALVRQRAFRIALVLTGGYLAVGMAGGFALALLERVRPADALFEAFSALGTVGLSRGLTPQLGSASKLLVIALMFAGRVLYPIWVLRLARGCRPAADPVDWV
jgi:trk system potassium uptake protein TrkH